MPRQGRGVGMHKTKKRKLEPVEPLPPPPVPMNLDELPADYVCPWTKKCLEATAPMSPEKTEVVRLTIEATCADECCNSLRKGMRECKRGEMCLKSAMYLKFFCKTVCPRRARRRSWQSGQQMSWRWLSARQGTPNSGGIT